MCVWLVYCVCVCSWCIVVVVSVVFAKMVMLLKAIVTRKARARSAAGGGGGGAPYGGIPRSHSGSDPWRTHSRSGPILVSVKICKGPPTGGPTNLNGNQNGPPE